MKTLESAAFVHFNDIMCDFAILIRKAIQNSFTKPFDSIFFSNSMRPVSLYAYRIKLEARLLSLLSASAF